MARKLNLYLNKIMSKFFKFFSFLVLLNCSGGGIGNIQIYEFNINKEDLKKCLDTLYKNHILMKPFPSLKYSYIDDEKTENCMIMTKKDTIIFNYELTYVEGQQKKSLLILLGCGKYGDVIELPSYMTKQQLDYYRANFNDYVIMPLETSTGSKPNLSR